jgi:hypothetical protein
MVRQSAHDAPLPGENAGKVTQNQQGKWWFKYEKYGLYHENYGFYHEQHEVYCQTYWKHMTFGSVEGNVEYVRMGQSVYACLYVYPICINGMKCFMVSHVTWAALDTLDKGKVRRHQKRGNSCTKSRWPFQEPKLEVPTIYKAHWKSGVWRNKNVFLRAVKHWADLVVIWPGCTKYIWHHGDQENCWMFIPGHFYRVSLWLSHPTEESCVAERLNSFATRTGCLPGSADPVYITLVMGVISQVIRCRTKLKLTPIASTAPPVVTSARRKTFDLGPGTSRSVGDNESYGRHPNRASPMDGKYKNEKKSTYRNHGPVSINA